MNAYTLKPIVAFACCAVVAACGGLPASNAIKLDFDGGGRFSGTAGADWSVGELEAQASSLFCGNAPVSNLNIRVLATEPDYKIFSGTCASGGSVLDQLPQSVARAPNVPPAPASQAAPVVTNTKTDPATWDGSTPFVD